MFKKGDVVTFGKGTLVESTNPSKEQYTLNRSRKVKVESFEILNNGESRKALIHWIGRGNHRHSAEARRVIRTTPYWHPEDLFENRT